MATNQQKLDNINARANWIYEKLVGLVREAVLWTSFDVQGTVRPKGSKTNLGTEISYMPQYFHNLQTAIDAQTKSLITALNAVAGGEKFDEAKLLAGIKAASEAGVKNAIASIETTVNIKKEK